MSSSKASNRWKKDEASSSGSSKRKEISSTQPAKQGAKKQKPNGWNDIESLFDTAKEEKRQNNAKTNSKKKKKKLLDRGSGCNRKFSSPSVSAPHKGKSSSSSSGNDTWVDDGLGGKYNSEGYTGRIEDGVKIFKTHLLQCSTSGQTDQCPFDCKCCFI